MGPDMVGSEMYVGTSFGELAMLTDVKRTATVRAMGNVSCLKLSKASIAPIIAQVRCTATTGDRLLATFLAGLRSSRHGLRCRRGGGWSGRRRGFRSAQSIGRTCASCVTRWGSSGRC